MARTPPPAAPYTRFVRSERDRIEKNESVLAGLRQKLSALRASSAAKPESISLYNCAPSAKAEANLPAVEATPVLSSFAMDDPQEFVTEP